MASFPCAIPVGHSVWRTRNHGKSSVWSRRRSGPSYGPGTAAFAEARTRPRKRGHEAPGPKRPAFRDDHGSHRLHLRSRAGSGLIQPHQRCADPSRRRAPAPQISWRPRKRGKPQSTVKIFLSLGINQVLPGNPFP
ncbi:hypothetical protein Tfu_0654 [Thermobifida fusca YX]|uniref:Uncharacterized protein n=1 Tax=Thermobifida fusca (strain YX) TaxID=269800 RepID=Q47S75_THEFY|nr:hypothetical protein Tfu_0654 [Thermobifida fusca YX]